MAAVAEIGVIGGSGFYEFLTDAEEVRVEPPWGGPGEPVLVGEVAGRGVAFLPRHGRDHRYPPHKIPYRANLWALRALGVRRILAPSAVGSLTASYGPGTLVIPDQLVDRTTGRAQSFYDSFAVHIPFADPYCPSGRGHAIEAARKAGWVPAGSGTLVVIDGPRFSTRAESQGYAARGGGRPRACPLLHDADAGHRHRRGRGRGRGGHPGRGIRGVRQEHRPAPRAGVEHHRRVPRRAGGRLVRARARRHQAAVCASLTAPFTTFSNFSGRTFYELSPRGMVSAVTEFDIPALDIPAGGTARVHVLHEGYVGL